MTDHAKRQDYLAEVDLKGCGNRLAVMLMLVAFVVPNLIFMVIG
jgi:hypothetical protein